MNKSTGWISNFIVLTAYGLTISGVFFVTQANTKRNAQEIEKQEKIHRADIERLSSTQKKDMDRMEDLILGGFKELRREINEIK